ncbi:MAG TPA: N,N-dimethylformamidase beta subunit family domain-containing protein [Streptosporangiaceae bacterium]|nr:N,N-dimethylformamidase beta subunit family domain-containing protein [Streptosporangiaceae bacterium]
MYLLAGPTNTATTRRPALPGASLAVALISSVLLVAGCSSPGGAPSGPGSSGTAAGSTSGAAQVQPFPVAENQKPGTPDWRVRRLGSPDAIEGFADRVSVPPGQQFRLFVSTTSRWWRVEAFRMGWYNGAQARRVWQSDKVAGLVQRAPVLSASTNMVRAPWRPSLTVRSASTAGAVVIINDVTTWQAYNRWGGYDLYTGPGGFADRARAVSFDRPYNANSYDNGAEWFESFDQAAIALAEKTGVPLAYETDVDLNQNPGLLSGARAVITLGHDEYYSAAMRDRLAAARDAGVNIAFLGANAVFRHIRFGSSPLGADRVVICYKVASEDPLFGVNNSATTQDWREPPDPRPESTLTGVLYECNPVSDAYVVDDPGNWIFAGTGARKGESFAGMVGPEYDRVNPAAPVPRPIEVLAHSPLTCAGAASYADSAYYTARGGAGVFASGTMRWVCAMRGRSCGHGVSNAARRFVDIATTNLLRVFAAGPAGLTHPARDNLARLHEASSFAGPSGD